MNFGKAVFMAIGALLPLQAQQTAAPAPKEFEVASVKPAEPNFQGEGREIMPGGRFVANNLTVKGLIEIAYDVKPFQVTGGPGWLTSDRYDINAKGGNASNWEQLRPMLQTLLAERFQLTIHRDTKELPTYSLVVAKNRSKLLPSSAEKDMMLTRRGGIEGEKITVSMFVGALSNQLARSVIDNTGLKGEYDLKLTWTADLGQSSGGLLLDSTGPSLMTALQEQLGLKLEARKGPVEIIVIDKAEKPAEN